MSDSASPDTAAPPAAKPLASAREEKFAQLMATGKLAAWEAMSKVRPELAESSWRTMGPELFRKPHIRERISQILEQSATRVAMGIAEWREFFEDAMRTPVGDIDENHPLCQEVTYEIQGGARGRLKKGQAPEGNEEIEPVVLVKKVKMVSKIQAANTLGEHHGWKKASKVEVGATDDLLEFLGRLRKPGIPKMKTPPAGGELPSLATPSDGTPNPPHSPLSGLQGV